MDSLNTVPGQYVYRLLGAEPSPYTAKLPSSSFLSKQSSNTGRIRAYLKYKNIPFREVIATEVVYKKLILPLTKVSFIPVLLVYDASKIKEENRNPAPLFAIQDTKIIVDYFEAMSSDLFSLSNYGFMSHPVMPQSPQLAFASMVFELIGDEWLINQAIYWRWGQGNFEQQREFLAFEYGSFAKGGLLGYDETYMNGQQKLPRLRGVLPFLGIDGKTSPVFRSQFKLLLKHMSSHFSKYPFLLGWEISVADFAFFGSFYAHLSRDPVPSFVIKTEAPLVLEWVERVGGLVRWAGAGIDRWDSDKGEWRATYGERKPGFRANEDEKDVVPPSSSQIVQLLLADYVTVLKDTVRRTIHFLSENCLECTGSVTVKLPRTLGRHSFCIGNAMDEVVAGERNVYTHSVWMLERIIDRTYSSSVQRSSGDKWLKTFTSQKILCEWKECVASWSMSKWKIGREANKLVARRHFVDSLSNL